MVLTDPSGPAQQVLLAPICSIKQGISHDNTCEIAAGEHAFVQHPSYVDYARCRLEFAEVVARSVNNGFFVEKAAVSEVLFAKIIGGMGNSKFTKPFASDFYDEFGDN